MALEIKKLEVWQLEILKIIEKLNEHISISNASDDMLMQVIKQIQDVGEKIVINIKYVFWENRNLTIYIWFFKL